MTFLSSINDSLTVLTSRLTDYVLPLVYIGLVPDFLIRLGIRFQLKDRLIYSKSVNAEMEMEDKMKIIEGLRTNPTIAIETDAANDQHYEVPAEFYSLCLGPRKKYSSGLWPNKKTTFAESEELMLDLYCQRAKVVDGMNIVDLGCGWGSLTLWLCEKYPNAKITSISNSSSQREYILEDAKRRGLNYQNITIITCNVSDDKGALDDVKDNDLVMTVEM